MKILFVPSDNNLTSGAFRSMSVLNKILNQKLGIETLVVLPNDGDGQTLLDEYGVKYTQINSTGWIIKSDHPLTVEENAKMRQNAIDNLGAVMQFAELIRKEKVDLIHVNTSYNYVAAMAAHICNKPVVWHLREFLEEDQKRQFYDKKYAHYLINKSDRIICISNALKNKYEGTFDKDKLQVIYNGIDVDTFYKPKKKILQNEKTIFFAAGAVNYNKGQDCLVKACGIVNQKGYTNFELWLAGTVDDRYTKIINDLAKKNDIGDKVKLLGRRSDVDELMSQSDIAFTCSKFEAFGRVTVEAMLSGLLLIGSNTGGTIEIVKDNETGLLFEQGNAEDLANKIIYALEHKKEMQKIADNGREDMKDNMSAERNAKEIAAVYDDVLAKFDPKENKIMAVVVTYNRLNFLKQCIDSLLNQTYQNLDILVVDNGSTDGTHDYVNSLNNPKIFYYNTTKNIGGAGGFNAGMKIAYFMGYKWVWIMDDDVIPTPTALKELEFASKQTENKNNAYFASCVYSPEGKPMNTPGVDPKATNGYQFWYEYLDKGMVRLNSATFVSLLINAKAIGKCGLPYKDFFIWGDDTEYTKRLYKYFGPAYLVGKSKVIHARKEQSNLSILTETDENRIKMYFYYIRNTLVYTKEYAGEEAYVAKMNLYENYIRDLSKSKDPHKNLKIATIRKGISAFNKFNQKKFAKRFDILLDDLPEEAINNGSFAAKTPAKEKHFYRNYYKTYGLKETIKRMMYGSKYKSFRWYFFKIVTFLPRCVFHLFSRKNKSEN